MICILNSPNIVGVWRMSSHSDTFCMLHPTERTLPFRYVKNPANNITYCKPEDVSIWNYGRKSVDWFLHIPDSAALPSVRPVCIIPNPCFKHVLCIIWVIYRLWYDIETAIFHWLFMQIVANNLSTCCILALISKAHHFWLSPGHRQDVKSVGAENASIFRRNTIFQFDPNGP